MKAIKFLVIPIFLILSSCSSVSVYSDYEKNTDFSQYKTYDFYKKGIEKVKISEFDKKRILQAIDNELSKKGMTKSETPDLLINIFTQEREQVDVSAYYAGWGYGWGFGWNPHYWGGYPHVSTSVEGTLYIDLIDAKKNELVWEGKGIGVLTQNYDRKEELINEFVSKILMQYPPIKK